MDAPFPTYKTGLLGWPVKHSLSPTLQLTAASPFPFSFSYDLLPVPPADLPTQLISLIADGYNGFNVTVPHKQTIIPLLDYVDADAAAIGAVNVITTTGDMLIGYNSDWLGFLADLDSLAIDSHNRETIILGAGGSARAVVYALASQGAKLHILARRPEQAAALATAINAVQPTAQLYAHPLSALPEIAASCNAPLIINTTPVGMHPHTAQSVWPTSCPFPSGSTLYDLVYNPQQTTIMKQAKAAGCAAFNGLGMLLHQGAAAFSLWTDEMPDLPLMRRALQIAIEP